MTKAVKFFKKYRNKPKTIKSLRFFKTLGSSPRFYLRGF